MFVYFSGSFLLSWYHACLCWHFSYFSCQQTPLTLDDRKQERVVAMPTGSWICVLKHTHTNKTPSTSFACNLYLAASKLLSTLLYSLVGHFVPSLAEGLAELYAAGEWQVGDKAFITIMGTASPSRGMSQSARCVLCSPDLSQPSHCFSAVTGYRIQSQTW